MTENQNGNHTKIIEVSGPNLNKEIEHKNLEDIEKNDNLENQISEINNNNENTSLNIVNTEQKEKLYMDAETQKDNNIELEEEKGLNDINNINDINDINEINEEKTPNLEITTNNNLSNIISTNNIDIMNLVKSQSYLTSLPMSGKSNQKNNNIVILNRESRKTYNCLKEKETSLCKEIKVIKQKRDQLNQFSFERLGEKNNIENNIRETELKNLKKSEINLMNKLEAIKLQITDLLNNEKKLNRKNNIKEYLERLKNNELNNDLIAKTKSLEAESNKYREKQRLDLEKAKNKKINEINKIEEELKNKKLLYLKAQREKEIEIMRKRKKEIDKKIEKTRKSIKNKPNFDPKNYLYNKLANQFEENEKKLLNQQKQDRKSKLSGIEEINIVKRRIIESKFELEKRRIEKTNEMHQLWHSRSLIMPKYQSNVLKKINEYEAKQAEDEEKEKIKKFVLVKEKEKYGDNIPLPPISEKLKGDREKRQVTFLNFEGKDRVKLIKDELSKNKCKNKNYLIEEKIFKQNSHLQKYRQRISKSQEKERKKGMIKSASCQNILNSNVNDILIKNIGGKPLSPVKLKRRRPNEINYLEELKKERKSETKNASYNWNKVIKESSNENGTDYDMVKKKIEVLEEKYQREKDLMNAKGGFLLNQDMGNDLNSMIINSIKGKLAIIENLNS